MNLVEALLKENEKSREFLSELDETEQLMGGNQPGIALSKALTKALIAQTEEAIASGDVLKMLAAANAHRIGSDDSAAERQGEGG